MNASRRRRLSRREHRGNHLPRRCSGHHNPHRDQPRRTECFRAFASKGFTTLLNWLFWQKVGYYNGAVLPRNDLLHGIEIRTNNFAYLAEALVKLIARGATYTALPRAHPAPGCGTVVCAQAQNQIAVWKTILHLLAEVGLFCRFALVPAPGLGRACPTSTNRHESPRAE
jgi:hypothetical protein